MTFIGPIPYELRIGVTGHRNLADAAGVASAVEKLLRQIANTLASASEWPRGPHGSQPRMSQKFDQYLCRCVRRLCLRNAATPDRIAPNNRTPIEWTVVSPLAKGADRIVATIMLKKFSARLIAIIPFCKSDYERDFNETDDLSEFRSLWNEASEVRELQRDHGHTSPADSASKDAQTHQVRNGGYEHVGREIVDECEILIAVWDGKPAAGQGGTAAIVAHAVDRGRVVLWIDSNNPSSPPHRVVARTLNHESGGSLPGMVMQPIPTAARELSPSFHQLAAYNRDATCDDAEVQSARMCYSSDLHKSARRAGLSECLLSPILSGLLPHFSRADHLASHFQRLYRWGAQGLYGLSALSVTIAVVQVLFFPHQLWLIAFEILALAGAVLLLRISRAEAWHEKWLHDRHLAEQLRLAMFTKLLPGGAEYDARVGDQTLPFYRGPDSWVQAAVKYLTSSIEKIDAGESNFFAIKRYLIDALLLGQVAFHAENARRKKRAVLQIHRGGLLLFLATLTLACLHWAGVGHGSEQLETTMLLANSITALAIVLPAWGAAIHAINVLYERERIAARSTEMARILNAIAQDAERAKEFDELRRHIDRAKQVMATENVEWWIALSFRELQLQG